MSKQTNFIQSRRNFLKGAAYTSALSIGGLSGVVYAFGGDTTDDKVSSVDISESNISVMQQKMLHKETVSLFNNSDEPIMLDALKPINIERVNGSLVVKPNVIATGAPAYTGMIMMHPSQRISFDIQTTGGIFSSAEIADVSKLEGQLMHITSEHSAFNKLIPVTLPHVVETQATMAVV